MHLSASLCQSSNVFLHHFVHEQTKRYNQIRREAASGAETEAESGGSLSCTKEDDRGPRLTDFLHAKMVENDEKIQVT